MRLPHTSNARTSRLVRAALGLALILAFAGCNLYTANKAYKEERYEEALEKYRKVLKSDPTNVQARIGLQRAKARAAEVHLAKARDAERKGYEDKVVLDFLRKAVVLDPDNQAAADWYVELEGKVKRQAEADAAADDVDTLKAKADTHQALQIVPNSDAPMGATFRTRTSLREILATLSRSTGVNIIMHTSFQDQSVAIDLQGLTFQKALDTLMLQNDLFYRVMDKNTIMVFKDTQQNREKYDNVIIKTYYLSYADPEPIRQMLVTLNPLLKIVQDKRMSAISVRAKREELAVVNRVIEQMDKPKAEVMVYLELMEVTENSLEKVGLLPVLGPADESGIYRIGATIDASGLPNQNKGAIRISKSDVRFLFPSLALDALKADGDAKLVASPNVRAVSGEKATVNIGEKISTTQSSLSLPTAGAAGSATQIPSSVAGLGQTNYSYENVGVKIEVEPRVHYNGEVTLKLKTEVTTLKSGSTPGRPDLGLRSIETFARLRDGETAIFGGLLKDEEQKSLQGIWGLADLPIIRQLTSNTRTQKAKTDVILTVRAVLVRKPNLTERDLQAYNPDEAYTQTGPFAAKPAPVKPAPKPLAPVTPSTPAAPQAPAAQPSAPTQAPAAAEPPKSKDIAEVAPTPEGQAARSTQASDLVIYVSPVVQQAKKGDKVQVSFLVSGGQGISTGSLEVRVSPNLKLLSSGSGDWITGEAGTLDSKPGAEGTKLTFKRNGSGSDSGTLVTLELEALAPGNGTVIIQGGSFMAGLTPVSGRWVNALVTVE
ncbi:MAG TPA: hypothetical protein VJ623_10630 [Holophagaceae bacterium]|nr:hypothetical protein [Holophagaceae bacterium]